ncbi:MAG: hypothetical protein CM1200mP31_1900 [Candidatus Neomarinimicrobiota bacterium]|nr:MAG: hypothetical protein CM1200mP31_1900 [Candidatus Neomarinimicrobiota bacterium]
MVLCLIYLFVSEIMKKIPSVGKKIDVLTYLNVRENLMELYGFLSKDRRDLFIQLISVSE